MVRMFDSDVWLVVRLVCVLVPVPLFVFVVLSFFSLLSLVSLSLSSSLRASLSARYCIRAQEQDLISCKYIVWCRGYY